MCNAGGQVDINTEVGVVHDIRLQELRLYTDFGRCCRPLFIVDQQRLKVPALTSRPPTPLELKY